MNNLTKVFLGSVLLAGSSIAMAKCPENLNADQMYDCIVVEGSGDFFVETAKTADAIKAKTEEQKADSDKVNLARANGKK